MGKSITTLVLFGLIILICLLVGSNCSNWMAKKDAEKRELAENAARGQIYRDSMDAIRKAEERGWAYRKKEDPMTSDTTYTAFRHSDESVITGGHWEDKSGTTATTTTETVQNRQRYSNKTVVGRMLNGPKSKTTTNTTVTSSNGREWVSSKGYMTILLTRNANEPTKAIIYCTFGEYNVNFSRVRFRFDKNKPVTFDITPYSYDSNETNGFIIDDTSKFISLLKEASTLLLEDNGGKQKIIFTFQVGGLIWEQ